MAWQGWAEQRMHGQGGRREGMRNKGRRWSPRGPAPAPPAHPCCFSCTAAAVDTRAARSGGSTACRKPSSSTSCRCRRSDCSTQQSAAGSEVRVKRGSIGGHKPACYHELPVQGQRLR